MAALTQPAMLTRLLLVNTAVVLAVFVVLAITPAPVTFPDGPWEAALLIKGGIVLVVANVLAVRFSSRTPPVRKAAPEVLAPSEALVRLRTWEHFEVASPDGVVGVVDEVLLDRDGTAVGLVVSSGWFGAERFLLGLADVAAVDEANRVIYVDGRPEVGGRVPDGSG